MSKHASDMIKRRHKFYKILANEDERQKNYFFGYKSLLFSLLAFVLTFSSYFLMLVKDSSMFFIYAVILWGAILVCAIIVPLVLLGNTLINLNYQWTINRNWLTWASLTFFVFTIIALIINNVIAIFII